MSVTEMYLILFRGDRARTVGRFRAVEGRGSGRIAQAYLPPSDESNPHRASVIAGRKPFGDLERNISTIAEGGVEIRKRGRYSPFLF